MPWLQPGPCRHITPNLCIALTDAGPPGHWQCRIWGADSAVHGPQGPLYPRGSCRHRTRVPYGTQGAGTACLVNSVVGALSHPHLSDHEPSHFVVCLHTVSFRRHAAQEQRALGREGDAQVEILRAMFLARSFIIAIEKLVVGSRVRAEGPTLGLHLVWQRWASGLPCPVVVSQSTLRFQRRHTV